MADQSNMVLYSAVYDDVDDALSDLDAIEQLHEDSMIGKFDAAVVDRENGQPHIVKRIDRPRIRVIPEAFGSGTLRRKELKEAASELSANQAAQQLIELSVDVRAFVHLGRRERQRFAAARTRRRIAGERICMTAEANYVNHRWNLLDTRRLLTVGPERRDAS